jgi:hypothetical protein
MLQAYYLNLFLSIIHYDSFLSKLWSIYTNGLENGYNQTIHLLILRTDYMLHKNTNTQFINKTKKHQNDLDDYTLKQVEINTMSAGFGFVSGCVASLHK